MKKLKIVALLFGGLSFLTCDVMAGGGATVEYYGSKTGLFKACKGELLTVCKRIQYPDKFTDELSPFPGGFDVFKPDLMSVEEAVPEEYATVVYDGVEYMIPVSWINIEDGSIIPQ